jgi:signal transduction histidine kinase
VGDDGPGIAQDAHPAVGSSSMHARIAYLGGRLTIRGSAGHGTHVHGSVAIQLRSSDPGS